tara:strand:- start:143 stop:439 length:297 start_codon:yes stop_codon:yes gene_type:complete
MSEPIKFTEDELTKVNELQGTYLRLQNTLGQISIGRIRLEQQLSEFDKAEDNVRKQFGDAQQNERDFIDKINKKYGDGNLDITTGLFTPKTEETTENK